MTNDKTRKSSSVTILRNRFFRIALTSLNSMTYFYNTSVFNRFVLTASLSPSDDQPALQNINDHTSMWNYIKGQLIDALYHDAWYNRLNVSFDEKEFIGHDNKLLGTARLRQLRVDPLKCNTPKYMRRVVEKCYPAYSTKTRYTGPIEIQGNITPSYTINAWNFSTSAITGASSYSAPYGSYDGSGYIQDLSRSRDEAEAILNELFQGRWIDQSTRVLFIDFALYNANINMFIIVKIIFEMPESGGLFSSSEIQPVKLFRYQTSTDYFILACEIVYLIFLVYYIIEEILELLVKRWKYFISIWNLMDLAMVVISLICAAFLIYSDIIVADRMSTLINDVSSYPNFDSLSNLHSLYIRSMAICVFLGMIKIFKYLTIDRSLNQLTRTMNIAANDLLGFLVMFCIVYFAYAQMSYLAFSARTIEYSSFTQTTYSLLRIMLVDESYKATKAELIKQKNDLTLYHILKKKTKDLARRVQQKRSKSIIRILRECGLMGLEKLPYEYYRKALKNNGYSDPEILSTFLKYDEDGDNNLDLAEQQQLAYEIEMGVIYKVEDPADEGIGTDEDSKENLVATIRDEDNYVDAEDYNELVQNVDLIEATLISIITRIDELLASLEKIEIAKREHRMQLSGIIKDMSQTIQFQ
ncbi:hypothetical protein MN116_007889 [Schistosoma mekongi]|uniref:Polycystin-2 n=1 Tax=Schistosoma mekongi TaxID=38744 RepID=A0AAE1Z8G6_SCHME|nr:hypothetical protein MN116_007889 [Schistosoma mekongi]